MQINLTADHGFRSTLDNQPLVGEKYECSLNIDLTGLFPVSFSHDDRYILLLSQRETLDFFCILQQLEWESNAQHPAYPHYCKFYPKSTHPLEIIDSGLNRLEYQPINFTREETLKILKNLKPHQEKFRELLIKTEAAQWEAKRQQEQAEEMAKQIRRQEAQELLGYITARNEAEAELSADDDSIHSVEEWIDLYGDSDWYHSQERIK